MGVDTNGNGRLDSTQKCEIPHLGEHWFNRDSVTNIIAMEDMTDRFCHKYHSNERYDR